jgi:hypothetical protein
MLRPKGVRMDTETLRPIIAQAPTRTFWLKRIGDPKSPSEQNTKYRLNRVKLDFSKKPASFQVGAIVISYSLGEPRVLYVAECYTPFRQASAAERAQAHWPANGRWTMWGVNLTPQYGSCWSTHDLYLGQMYAAFQIAQPEELAPLDVTGQGQAEQRISSAFGAYVMRHIAGLAQPVTA